MVETTIANNQPVSDEYLEKMNAYWRAANYLGAAQLYLLDNPLLREPLTMEHVKKLLRSKHLSGRYLQRDLSKYW